MIYSACLSVVWMFHLVLYVISSFAAIVVVDVVVVVFNEPPPLLKVQCMYNSMILAEEVMSSDHWWAIQTTAGRGLNSLNYIVSYMRIMRIYKQN